MCGIIGYLGQRLAMSVLLEGLYAQEYRGYDSAGIAVLEDNQIRLIRSTGKIEVLDTKINNDFGTSTIGIGHTRWATHGRPSDENCHPHLDCKNSIALVHNGIIENYQELRQELQQNGHIFRSQTDTEVLPHLLEEYYDGNLVEAMFQTVKRLRGFYAMVAMCKDEPRRLVAARLDNPLIIGIGKGEYFFASDMAALIDYTRDMLILQNGDIADITEQGVIVYHDGKVVERQPIHIDWDKEAAKKGGYAHYMIKEINEQPNALAQTMKGRINDSCSEVVLNELTFSDEYLRNINKIAIVACGTAYHAGLVGKLIIEKLLRIPVEVDLASEFIHQQPLVDERTLSIVISQSGETLDSLSALRVCRNCGAKVISICNVVDSSIARESYNVLYTLAGPEIAVASTKAYSTHLMVLYMLAFHMAARLGKMTDQQLQPLIKQLFELPQLAEKVLHDCEDIIKPLAQNMSKWEDCFFIGRGLDYAIALEGALKLKEVSYIHAEAYAAGELKHGTIALIVDQVPVVALATQESVLKMMVSNIVELKARDAFVIGLSFDDAPEVDQVVDASIHIPKVDDLIAPMLTVIPLQILAYYTALYRDCAIDQPRNLAKSVTVP